MPIFEYACTHCGKTFEELVLSRSSEAAVNCPACKSREVDRLISRPAAARTGGAGSSSPPAGCGPIG